MRIPTVRFAVAMALLAVHTSAGAQGRPFNVPQRAQPTPSPGLQAQPFAPSRRPQQRQLFPLPDRSRKVPEQGLSCGRVIPATPEIDPKILKTVPDDGITYTMRKVPAPPCVAPNVAPPAAAPQDAR